MAEKIVSPGVFTRENDLSFIQQGVGAIGAAVVGPFKQGPAFIPTIINTQSEFSQLFGEPDGTYYTEQTVQNYLRESGTVTVVRVGGVGGYQHEGVFGIWAVPTGSANPEDRVLLTTINSTEVGDLEGVGFDDVVFTDVTGSTEFQLSGSLGVVTGSVVRSNPNDIQSIYGRSALGTKNGYLYTYFSEEADEYEESLISGAYGLSGSVIEGSQDYSYDMSNAHTPWVVSNDIGGEVNELFRFRTKGSGNASNRQFKISISNIQGSKEDFATFTVSIRDFNDTDRRPQFLETWSNVNLDPTSPNFIGRVIGDRYQEVDSNGDIQERGTWPSNSQYVTVEVKEENTYNDNDVPYGHTPYINPITTNVNGLDVPAVSFSIESDDNDASNTRNYSGLDFDSRNSLNYLNPLPEDEQVGNNYTFLLSDEIISLQGVDVSNNDPDIVAKRQFTLGFQGGFDGKSPAVSISRGSDIDSDNSQGFDLTGSTASGSLSYQRIARVLENQDLYDFNLVTTPGVIRRHHEWVTTLFEDLVERRGDAFYIADLVGPEDSISQVLTQANGIDSSYVGTYYPWVRVVDPNTNRQLSVPPSVLLPAVYAANDRIGAEWYAPAGLNRGGITGAIGTSVRIDQNDRDELYEGKVNPISSFPNQGIVAWGQKTLQERPSALDRINVRRLLIKSKKFIASTSRFLVFEQNTSTTRNRFLNTVNPYFESIQQRQGLYAFRVVMDETNNTPDVVDRNILKGSIFLQPTRTAEFIVIDFNVLPTGATFDV